MLTEPERSLIARTFAQGPAVLFESGYSPEAVRGFLDRPDVQAHFLLLQREFDHHDALQARTRVMARRSLSRLSPHAVAVLGQALAGPQYVMRTLPDGTEVPALDANGRPILARPEVLPTQLRAAEVILEALGVQCGKAKVQEVGAGADTGVSALFKSEDPEKVTLSQDQSHTSEAQRALSRERVRNVIEVLAAKVPALHKTVNDSLSLPASSGKTRSKRGKKGES